MSTPPESPPKTDWVREFATRSDESLWDEYVNNQRNWREDDGNCHSAENVLSEVLTGRGILAASPNEILWAVLETLFPNRSDLKPALLQHVRDNEHLFNQAREEIAKGLTAAKRRGRRVGSGQFIFNAGDTKALTTEMPWRGLGRDDAGHAIVDVTALAQRAVCDMMDKIPDFCKFHGLRADQVEVRTSFLLGPDGQHIMRVWIERKR